MGRRTASQELLLLGERIRERRIKLRLSQEALAEKAGISANTVSRIEGGQMSMGILRCLTDRQRAVVSLCLFQQKTRKEAARELGISSPAVSAILSQAARRLRKRYPPQNRAGKAVAAI